MSARKRPEDTRGLRLFRGDAEGELWAEQAMPEPEGWRVRFRLVRFGVAGVAVVEVRVFPADESKAGRGLRAAHLRKVPFGSLQTLGRKLDSHWREQRVRRRAEEPKGKRKRRPASGWSDERYARIAEFYAAQVAKGSRRANVDVAKRFKLTTAQARDAVHAARERGMLTETAQGMPGGFLTDYGRSLLASRKGQLRTKKGR